MNGAVLDFIYYDFDELLWYHSTVNFINNDCDEGLHHSKLYMTQVGKLTLSNGQKQRMYIKASIWI